VTTAFFLLLALAGLLGWGTDSRDGRDWNRPAPPPEPAGRVPTAPRA
jgi:hypothetical protein